jgi:osmoprotectant transport system permease protein
MSIQAAKDVSTSYSQPSDRKGKYFTAKRFGTPLLIAAALGALLLFLSLRGAPDKIESFALNWPYMLAKIDEHIRLSIAAALLVAIIAIPAGIIVSRSKSKIVRGLIVGIGNVGQATPAVGVIILLALILGIGWSTAIIALVFYGLLPVIRNTMVGISQINPSIIESARGMGMTGGQILRKIELPLAVPVILAGFRTTLVFSVGVATIATFINAGGLGEVLVVGLKLSREAVTLTGAVVVSCIALGMDWLAGLIEDLLKPKGV